jgi:hypothetical protein
MTEIRLDSASIDAVARRVVELLAEPTPLPTLLSARDVAARLDVAESWVRQHADDLGAIRLTEGNRPRIRFDPAVVAETLARRSPGKRSPTARSGTGAGIGAVRGRSGPATLTQKVPLLPATPPQNTRNSSASPKSQTGRRRDNAPPPTPRKQPSTPAQRSPDPSRSG